MNAHHCTTCNKTGFTAATEPSDLAALPCPYCGASNKPAYQVVNDVIGKVINLFEPLR